MESAIFTNRYRWLTLVSEFISCPWLKPVWVIPSINGNLIGVKSTPAVYHCKYIWYKLFFFYAINYNPGQNLLRQIAKMPVFSCHPGKNWNLRQMNARFLPSPHPKLFRIAWQLYTLVFRPRQLWIGGGEGVYVLCLGETGVGRKS